VPVALACEPPHAVAARANGTRSEARARVVAEVFMAGSTFGSYERALGTRK
jgi:hypothetical protein